MQEVVFGEKEITPSKVVCVGRNYVAHIEELGNEMPDNMVLFNKPNSAISQTLDYFSPTCRFEGELCLLIKEGKAVGLGLGLDLTYASIQNILKQKGLPWERAKAFNGSAVMSKFIGFEEALDKIRFTLHINGMLIQEADHTLMMYKPHQIIEEIQTFMTLEDYDIIMTGTPQGVGTYKKGDHFEMKLFSEEKLLLASSWEAK